MSQCTSANFPGIFGIFRIFFRGLYELSPSSRLFFSPIMNSENKRNSFFLLSYSFILFSPHICLGPINPKSAGAPRTPCVVRFFSSAQLSTRSYPRDLVQPSLLKPIWAKGRTSPCPCASWQGRTATGRSLGVRAPHARPRRPSL
jgi:hypothetical protein